MSKMSCNGCEKRDSCKELCPEAEKYANQDQVRGDFIHGEGVALMSQEMLERYDDKFPLNSIWDLAGPDTGMTPGQLGRLNQRIKAYVRYKNGESLRTLAKEFGVSKSEMHNWVIAMQQLEKRATSNE